MLKRQVLAGLQLYCSNAVTVILLQCVNKIGWKWSNLLLNKENLKTGKYKQNSLSFSKHDEFSIVTGLFISTEMH